MTKKYHLSIAKHLIIQGIEKLGSRFALNGWNGSDEEAIKEIENDPREYFTLVDCDNQDKSGKCLGHLDH